MKFCKSILRLAAVGALAAVLLAGCGQKSVLTSAGSGEGEPTALVFSIAEAPESAQGLAQLAFQSALEELSGGKMTVECRTGVSPDGQLDALKSGEIDVALTGAAQLTDGSPWVSMFTAGYVFRDYGHMTRVLNGAVGQEIFERVAAEQGVVPLGGWYLNARQIALRADRSAAAPADLGGVSLRMPDAQSWAFLGGAMGAETAAVPLEKLDAALESGDVDGLDGTLEMFQSTRLYRGIASVTLTGHILNTVWPAMSLERWNALTAVQQDWVMQAQEAARAVCDEAGLRAEDDARQFLEAQGLRFYDADLAAFAETVLAAYRQSAISQVWDLELLDRVEAAAAPAS